MSEVIRKINIQSRKVEKKETNAPFGDDGDFYDDEEEVREEDEDKPKRRELTTVIASSPTPDRYNDIVEPSWNLERFLSNPVVPFAHDYTVPPVGRVQGLKIVEGQLIAQIEWDDSEENELGRIVASQFERGFMNAVSVGFSPGEVIPRNQLPDESPYKSETGNLYRNPELLEISAVPIPAHQDALALRSHKGPELKRILSMDETDHTFVVTYAKEIATVNPERDEPADPMTEVFGHHDLHSLFGQ